MKELFLETSNGIIPLEQGIIEKYDIKNGTYSPFTRCRIVDKNGVFNTGKKDKKDKTDKTDTDISQMPEGEGLADDNIIEFPEGEIYSTSEIIEISQGADSSVEDI